MIPPIEVEAESTRLSALAAVRLEQARLAAGVSRSELAQRAGVSRSRVTKVLSGTANVTLETLARFSVALGVRLVIAQPP